jgi:hypothetical protein
LDCGSLLPLSLSSLLLSKKTSTMKTPQPSKKTYTKTA